MKKCEKCKYWSFFHAYVGTEGNAGVCYLKARLRGNQADSECARLFNNYAYGKQSCSFRFRLFMRLVYFLKRLFL